MLMAVVASRGVDGQSAFNPLHFGEGPGFSDAFLLLTLPVLVVMALSLVLPTAEARSVPALPIPPFTRNSVANCSVPWMPEFAEMAAGGAERVTPVLEAEYASSRPR